MHYIDINTLDKDSTDYTQMLQNYIDSEKGLEIEFCYVSDFKHTKTLRNVFQSLCELYQFDNMLISRMTLVIDEMNNNAIEYGSQSWDINIMRIVCNKHDDDVHMHVEVEDSWKGSSHKTAHDMEQMRDQRVAEECSQHRSIRWRGLFMIIVNIVDRLYFTDSKKGWLIVGIERVITPKG